MNQIYKFIIMVKNNITLLIARIGFCSGVATNPRERALLIFFVSKIYFLGKDSIQEKVVLHRSSILKSIVTKEPLQLQTSLFNSWS